MGQGRDVVVYRARCGMAWYGMARRGLAGNELFMRCGRARLGLAWSGAVGSGVVGYGRNYLQGRARCGKVRCGKAGFGMVGRGNMGANGTTGYVASMV